MSKSALLIKHTYESYWLNMLVEGSATHSSSASITLSDFKKLRILLLAYGKYKQTQMGHLIQGSQSQTNKLSLFALPLISPVSIIM